MKGNISHIAGILKGTITGPEPSASFDNISIDSRSLQHNPGTLFFALSGPNHDAHTFIDELIRKGVCMFVVSYIPNGIASGATFLTVPDTLKALQQFAASYRSGFNFPVIGITGSNGKTIVKEWLNFLLGPDFSIVRSPKSYNSQVGVPLSVFAINERHNLGIFEVGISTIDEMLNLEPIVRPTIGILTNIGPAHDEGFSGEAQKLQEKLGLFTNAEVVICEHALIAKSDSPGGAALFTWSYTDHDADVVSLRRKSKGRSVLAISCQDRNFEVTLPFTDEASTENAMHCIATMLYLSYEDQTISRRVSLLYSVDMRLTVKKGINGSTIIDDSYSSDFQSLKIALDFLESQNQHKRKTLILSDIFQSGLPTDELYNKVASLVRMNKVSRIIGIGKTISAYADLFAHSNMFTDTGHFLETFDELEFANEAVLVKGARSFGFERIVALLEERTHETVLEINLNSIVANLNYFKSKLHQQTMVMVMIKAYGYGNGGFEVAKLLEHQKVDYLGVAFADEGISLKAAGISVPIMVLNPENTSFPAIIQHGLEPEIYSFKGLRAFIHLAKEKKLESFPIHLKLDTGMHRLGFSESDLGELTDILGGSPQVHIKSLLSHLATADDLQNRAFAMRQLELFDRMSENLMRGLLIRPLRHILNTSGISNFPEAQYDMVRLGIGVYGFSNDAEEQKSLSLVSTLMSVISQIRTIPADDSVGYGRRYIANKTTTIATIPIGYADGIAIAWGRAGGYVVIHGKRAPITGSVCMDMLMVDVTDIDCREGDRVTVFGKDPDVTTIAAQLDTIPYEILTGISHRVKRVFFRE